jgi:hypothetical protein
VLGLAAAILLIALVPAPRPVLRMVAVATAPWFLATDLNDGRLVAAGKRLLRTYIQLSLAAHVANDVIDERKDDVSILIDVINASRRIVLPPPDQKLLRYDIGAMPAFVSGVGYCDQINAVVASVAAHHFEHAELFSLYERSRNTTPHTVGRVWSARRRQWLYYDAFYSHPVIFTKAVDGRAQLLWTREPLYASRLDSEPQIYDLPGWTLSRFPRRLGMFVLERAGLAPHGEPPVDQARAAPRVNKHPLPKKSPAVGGEQGQVQSGRDERASAQPSVLSVDVSRPETPGVLGTDRANGTDPSFGTLSAAPAMAAIPISTLQSIRVRNDEDYARISRKFVDARLDQLFGQPDPHAFEDVAKDPGGRRDDRAAELANAARTFADRLAHPR